eukprot:918750-Prymnesium_polylepis.1
MTVWTWLRTASSKAGTTVALVRNDERQCGVVRVLRQSAASSACVCARACEWWSVRACWSESVRV